VVDGIEAPNPVEEVKRLGTAAFAKIEPSDEREYLGVVAAQLDGARETLALGRGFARERVDCAGKRVCSAEVGVEFERAFGVAADDRKLVLDGFGNGAASRLASYAKRDDSAAVDALDKAPGTRVV
jgi:hypothetical protein